MHSISRTKFSNKKCHMTIQIDNNFFTYFWAISLKVETNAMFRSANYISWSRIGIWVKSQATNAWPRSVVSRSKLSIRFKEIAPKLVKKLLSIWFLEPWAIYSIWLFTFSQNQYINLRSRDCLWVSVRSSLAVWIHWKFVSQVSYAPLKLFILGKCYAVHINASSL